MKKILVCDDDRGILEVIKIILETNNYEVKTLDNGKNIKNIILEYQPNLIFLDIWMPGIEGTEIIKILKRDASTAEIPIIIISALSDTEKISKDLEVTDFLSKPFDLNDLLGKTKQYVS